MHARTHNTNTTQHTGPRLQEQRHHMHRPTVAPCRHCVQAGHNNHVYTGDAPLPFRFTRTAPHAVGVSKSMYLSRRAAYGFHPHFPVYTPGPDPPLLNSSSGCPHVRVSARGSVHWHSAHPTSQAHSRVQPREQHMPLLAGACRWPRLCVCLLSWAACCARKWPPQCAC